MSSLEFDQDAYYVCTEASPRCFIVQKINPVHAEQFVANRVGSLEAAGRLAQVSAQPPPPPPMLPYWFTEECERELLSCGAATATATAASALSSDTELRALLKAQLEYYFSRENLVTDRYLRSQMAPDQFVPIAVIAGFPKILQLTQDYRLIVDVLRESSQVEVDEKGERVRPFSKRCTIILREIDEHHEKEVEALFKGCPPYLTLRYGLNDSWYVTFATEEDTQAAYLHLQTLEPTVNRKGICARIKTGGPPSRVAQTALASSVHDPAVLRNVPLMVSPVSDDSLNCVDSPSSSAGSSHSLDVGRVLAQFGYVPRATYRPSATVLHVADDRNSVSTATTITSAFLGGGGVVPPSAAVSSQPSPPFPTNHTHHAGPDDRNSAHHLDRRHPQRPTRTAVAPSSTSSTTFPRKFDGGGGGGGGGNPRGSGRSGGGISRSSRGGGGSTNGADSTGQQRVWNGGGHAADWHHANDRRTSGGEQYRSGTRRPSSGAMATAAVAPAVEIEASTPISNNMHFEFEDSSFPVLAEKSDDEGSAVIPAKSRATGPSAPRPSFSSIAAGRAKSNSTSSNSEPPAPPRVSYAQTLKKSQS